MSVLIKVSLSALLVSSLFCSTYGLRSWNQPLRSRCGYRARGRDGEQQNQRAYSIKDVDVDDLDTDDDDFNADDDDFDADDDDVDRAKDFQQSTLSPAEEAFKFLKVQLQQKKRQERIEKALQTIKSFETCLADMQHDPFFFEESHTSELPLIPDVEPAPAGQNSTSIVDFIAEELQSDAAPAAGPLHAIADAISGIYHRCKHASGACPNRLQLTASVSAFDNTSNLFIKFPKGLRDFSGVCKNEEGSSARVSLIDSSDMEEGSFPVSAAASLVEGLHAALPAGGLSCLCAPGNPFTHLSVTPLNRYMVPLLKQRLQAVGLNAATLAHVFGAARNASVSEHSRAERTRRRVHKALAFLRQDYVLTLQRDSSACRRAVPPWGCPPPAEMCVLKGGAADDNTHTEKFMQAIVELHGAADLPLPRVAGAALYPSRERCAALLGGAGRDPAAIGPLLHRHAKGRYGKAALFPLHARGETCARVELYRFSEIIWGNGFMPQRTSLLAHEVKKLLGKSQERAEQNRGSDFIAFFADFLKKLRAIEHLANIFVGRLSFQHCAKYTPALDFVLVKMPLAAVYCRRDRTKGTQLQRVCADGNRSPRRRLADMGLDLSDADLDEIGAEPEAEFTVFFTDPQKCVYSTSKENADRFQKAVSEDWKKKMMSKAWRKQEKERKRKAKTFVAKENAHARRLFSK